MAGVTGNPQVFPKPTTLGTTDATLIPLGSFARDTAGNGYIWVQAGESFVAGEWCVWSSDYIASQIGATSRGAVGVVQSTMTSDDHFWAKVEGVETAALCTSGVTTAGYLVSPATTDAGYVGEGTLSTGVANKIFGAIARSAGTSAGTAGAGAAEGTCTVQLMRPYVEGVDINWPSS